MAAPAPFHMTTRFGGTKVPFTGERKRKRQDSDAQGRLELLMPPKPGSERWTRGDDILVNFRPIDWQQQQSEDPEEEQQPPGQRVKKINIRFRIPDTGFTPVTGLTEYWRDGKKMVVIHREWDRNPKPWEGGGFVATGEPHPPGLKTCQYMGLGQEHAYLAPMDNMPRGPENGEFIVVLDSMDRENEGDLIIAAEAVTTEKMAFMIRHSSGLICAPLSSSLTEQLDLPQMVKANADPNRTAYTVSIDASDPSITTGISAHDRALTCRQLAAPNALTSSFRRPGHVFPLRARAGGIRERKGHTEAAVEFCRLAGRAPVGVICELVEDGEEVVGKAERKEGGMMRRDGCLKFGKKFGLKVCTIEDLIEHVERETREETISNGHA
ncbi:MAG: hypothetical protein Q9220_007787 [cf. Caloplaca sp. 1 TL-2023]